MIYKKACKLSREKQLKNESIKGVFHFILFLSTLRYTRQNGQQNMNKKSPELQKNSRNSRKNEMEINDMM